MAYASRALTPAEQRYVQIEKEMLAVVFGCERFHKLIYGKDDVTVESDHKPLESIMKKPIRTAPMRIQRMMLKLQPYEFTLVHSKGKDVGLADCLSRLPLEGAINQSIDDELMVLTVDTLSCSNHEKIAQATKKDEQFQILKQVISTGWPKMKGGLPVEVMPFWDYRDELAVYNGVIYRGEKVCIPADLRQETLKVIHNSHLGVVNCRKRARELLFWPGMSKQIEDIVSKCSACLTYRNKPAKEPMIMHEVPQLPWSKVGTDLFELEGNHYLIMVDYYSNFIEVAPLQRDTRTSVVINQMKQIIARYGIMDTLISDNGPQFTSAEFKDFVMKYNISHITSSPLHQQSNGLAEKAVQTVKDMIRKCRDSGDDIYLSLLELRNTPRDTETGSPMQRLMGRRGKTLIPITQILRKPMSSDTEKVQSRLTEFREKQKFYYDKNAKVRQDIKPDDAVRIYTPKGWKPAEYVEKSTYPRSHVVKAGDSGREYRRNSNMLLNTREKPHVIMTRNQVNIPSTPPVRYDIPKQVNRDKNVTPPREVSQQGKPNQPPVVQKSTNQSCVTQSRYGREIRRPKHLKDFV